MFTLRARPPFSKRQPWFQWQVEISLKKDPKPWHILRHLLEIKDCNYYRSMPPCFFYNKSISKERKRQRTLNKMTCDDTVGKKEKTKYKVN